jgi:hypothetical protein
VFAFVVAVDGVITVALSPVFAVESSTAVTPTLANRVMFALASSEFPQVPACSPVQHGCSFSEQLPVPSPLQQEKGEPLVVQTAFGPEVPLPSQL